MHVWITEIKVRETRERVTGEEDPEGVAAGKSVVVVVILPQNTADSHRKGDVDLNPIVVFRDIDWERKRRILLSEH